MLFLQQFQLIIIILVSKANCQKMGSQCCSVNKNVKNAFYYKQSQEFAQKYILGRNIGKGGCSQVKVASDNKTKQKYAVKIVDKAQTIKNLSYTDILNQKRVYQKVQSQSAKPSQFIVRLFQCLQDRQKLYFILEYLPYGNLRNLLKTKKTLKQNKIKFFCICILLALKNLNQLQIIHGDLKPENILIDKDGYFKIADFSSAQRYGCQAKSIKGTTGYMAPELISQQQLKLKGNSSDLYSLGVILWQMINGMKYIYFKGVQQSKNNISMQLTGDSSQGQVQNYPISNQLENFVSCLIKQKPNERPNIRQLWHHPWLALSENKIEQHLRKQANPFAPVQKYFQYAMNEKGQDRRIQTKISYDQSDELLSSVLLNQRKYQNLFSSFSHSPFLQKMDRSKSRRARN